MLLMYMFILIWKMDDCFIDIVWEFMVIIGSCVGIIDDGVVLDFRF